jgi:hypothetical protein
MIKFGGKLGNFIANMGEIITNVGEIISIWRNCHIFLPIFTSKPPFFTYFYLKITSKHPKITSKSSKPSILTNFHLKPPFLASKSPQNPNFSSQNTSTTHF